MATIINNLLPYRDYDEHEVINLFALNNTGVAGLLVTPSVFNPDSGDGYSSVAVGATYGNTLSNRYESKAKVALSASGDTKFKVLGIMLKDTREVDENGEKLLYHPELATKMNCVISGQNTPILRRGLVTLGAGAYDGVPTIGSVGLISNSGNGKIFAALPSALPASGYTSDSIVGKFISTPSTKLGGYALFLLDL
jgi:hypothetical protein